MSGDFLQNLFENGEVAFHTPPGEIGDRGESADLLKAAFAVYRLEIAGPAIDFDAAAAQAAADFARWACWFLVHRDSAAEEVTRRLALPHPPRSAAQHLSADLTFRYLAQLHRRALALSPDDALTRRLAEVLRAFPLSGVLAAVDEPPTTPLDFAGHTGLEMLYAERFAHHPRESWRAEGRIAELVELVQR